MQMQGYHRTIASDQGSGRYRVRMLFALAVTAAAVGVSAATALATTYSATELPSLGGLGTNAVAINENGQMAGASNLKKTIELPPQYCGPNTHRCTEEVYHAFLSEGAGKLDDLGTLGGDFSHANALNNLGEVVGSSQTKSGPEDEEEAFLFRNAKMTGIGAIVPTAINDLGVIAGYRRDPAQGQFTEAIIDQNGKITVLAGPGSGAVGINNSDEVAGNGGTNEQNDRAWVWHNGTLTDLGTLGGSGARAYAINNSGQIDGDSANAAGASRDFIYQNGKMTELGPFPLPPFLTGLNNNGVIVGDGGSGPCGEAVIIVNDVCENLQSMLAPGSGISLRGANGINDKGQIIASAANTASGDVLYRSQLLTPEQ
jgi:probable HAF family extracellular repeat protein